MKLGFKLHLYIKRGQFLAGANMIPRPKAHEIWTPVDEVVFDYEYRMVLLAVMTNTINFFKSS
jgi:hypothetical protein